MSLLKCANWADDRRLSESIAFIFDDGNANRQYFQRAFDVCKRSRFGNPYHFGSLTFADDKMILPLQAADFIAYEVGKVCTDAKHDRRRFRGSLQHLLQSVPVNCTIATEELLLGLANRVEHIGSLSDQQPGLA